MADITDKKHPFEGYIFRDDEHETAFHEFVQRMNSTDVFSITMAYLLSCDEILRDNVDTFFNFKEHAIKRDSINSAVLTGTSTRTLRFAYNLWNGFYDEENPGLYTPYEFCWPDPDFDYRICAMQNVHCIESYYKQWKNDHDKKL